eukprot:m.61176 g.61176  ORF g.61176 m.61176 type:complete len:149 (+) comp9545_c0_seq2:533-979(+)
MSAEYLRSYLRAIDETPLEMQLGVTQLTNQDFEAIELVRQIRIEIEAAKSAKTEEDRLEHNSALQELFKKVLYRVQMQGEISTELGLRINATQRELGAERGHWESGWIPAHCLHAKVLDSQVFPAQARMCGGKLRLTISFLIRTHRRW